MSLQQMREARAEAGKTILRLRDKITAENREFNTEERAEWDKSNKAFDDLGQKIDDFKRARGVEKYLAGQESDDYGTKPGAEDFRAGGRRRRDRGIDGQERTGDLAMSAWFARQSGRPLTSEQRLACRAVGLNPASRTLEIRLPQRPGVQLRAQGVATGAAGSFTVPQGFVSNLEVALKMWNAVRLSGAEVIRTDTGNPLPWPTINDTANVGTLLAENTTVGASVDMTFGQTTFNAYKFSSGLVLVSSELEQDNGVGLVDRMGTLLGERVGRGQEGYFTTGTGTSQPQGIVTGATLGKTAASPTAIVSDELFDLFHAVDPAYRNDPSFGWMMNDSTLKTVRKLKDSSNRYLWVADYDTGIVTDRPGTLLGKPITVNQSMANIATTAKVMLAGAFSKFKVRDAGVVRIRRLIERYGDTDQVGYLCFVRSDSKLLDAGTHPIQYLQMA